MHLKYLRLIVYVTAGLVLMIMLTVLIRSSRRPAAPLAATPTPVVSPAIKPDAFVSKTSSIIMNEYPPGRQLTLATVVTDVPGFVIIHTSTDDVPYTHIGTSALLPAGTSHDIPVSLTENTIAGQLLFATLHRDNGDSVFTNAEDDSVILHPEGSTVTISFTIEE